MSADQNVSLDVRYLDDATIKLVISERGEERDVTLTPGAAASIARALLATSAVCQSSAAEKVPSGTAIADCHLPVQRWALGTAKADNQPVVVFRVAGVDLIFQMAPQTTIECAQAMVENASRASVRATQS